MKNITKRIMALLASAVTAVTTLSANYSEVFAEEQQETIVSMEDSDNEIETGGFLGELMQDEFQNLAAEKNEEKSSDYAIYKISCDPEVACVKVDYHAVKDCTLFVGFYNDEGTELVTSMTKELKVGSKEHAEMYVSDILPDTYLIKAFMVDTDFLNPLSKPYVYNRCTRQMKEILQKTPEEYNPERVVKIDENNFIVLKDDVKIITPTETTDVFKGEDEDGNCIFENAVEIAKLKEGDKVFVNSDPKAAAFVVDSIKTDDNSVIVVRKKAQLGELIRFIKIASETGNNYADIPNQEDKTEVITREKLPQPLTGNTNYENTDSLQFPTIKSEAKWAVGRIYLDHTFELSKSKGRLEGAGSLRLVLDGPFELYYDWDNEEIYSLSLEVDFTAEISVSASVELFEPDVRIPVFESGALNIYVCPKLTVKLKGEGVASYQRSFYLNYDSGYDSGDDSGSELNCGISEPAIIKLEGKIAIEISLSINLEFDITMITLLKIGPAEVWTIEAEKDFVSNDPENEYIRHDCEDCFDINITRATQLNVTFCFEFFGKKWAGWEYTITESGPENPVASFHRKNGITYSGKCANKSHKIILDVYTDTNDKQNTTSNNKKTPVQNVEFFIEGNNAGSVVLENNNGSVAFTDSKGHAEVWVKDKLMTDSNSILTAKDTKGNSGQIAIGELFNKDLKEPNKFEIILNNEQKKSEYPKTGTCGIDPDKSTVYIMDKSKGDSYNPTKHCIIKSVNGEKIEVSVPESDYDEFEKASDYKCIISLYAGIKKDTVKYVLDENGEIRFEGFGYIDPNILQKLSKKEQLKKAIVGYGVKTYYPLNIKGTNEQFMDGLVLHNVIFGSDESAETRLFKGVEVIFEGNNGGEIIKGFANDNPYISRVELSDFTKIGRSAFSNCNGLSGVILSSNLEEIDDYAFYNCTKLENIDFYIGLKNIGREAFYGSALKSVDIPNTVESIGIRAFNNTPLKRIAIYSRDCILENYCIPANTTVCGYMNSTAHRYVLGHSDQKLKFVPLDPNTPDTVTPTNTTTKATTTTTITTTALIPKSTAVVTTQVAPDSKCVFIAVKDKDTAGTSSDKVFTDGNVKFFDQQTANADGVVSFSYLSDEKEKWAFIFVSQVINDTITQTFGTANDLKTATYSVAPGVKGDANGDGEIDMSDVVLIMQALANPNKYGVEGTDPKHITENGFQFADSDGDGLTVNDALRIQQYLLGLIPSLT